MVQINDGGAGSVGGDNGVFISDNTANGNPSKGSNNTTASPQSMQASNPVAVAPVVMASNAPTTNNGINIWKITPAAPGYSAAVYYGDSQTPFTGLTTVSEYDKLSPIERAAADAFALSQGIDKSSLSAATNNPMSNVMQGQQPLIDASGVTNAVLVNLPQNPLGAGGSQAMFQQTRDILSKLPDWTPVKLGEDDSNGNVFAYHGGLVNQYGQYYTGYGPSTAGSVAISQGNIDAVNQYLNASSALSNPSPINTGISPINTGSWLTQKNTSGIPNSLANHITQNKTTSTPASTPTNTLPLGWNLDYQFVDPKTGYKYGPIVSNLAEVSQDVNNYLGNVHDQIFNNVQPGLLNDVGQGVWNFGAGIISAIPAIPADAAALAATGIDALKGNQEASKEFNVQLFQGGMGAQPGSPLVTTTGSGQVGLPQGGIDKTITDISTISTGIIAGGALGKVIGGSASDASLSDAGSSIRASTSPISSTSSISSGGTGTGSSSIVDAVLRNYAKETPENYAQVNKVSSPWDMTPYLKGGKLYSGTEDVAAPAFKGAINDVMYTYDAADNPVRIVSDQQGTVFKIIDNPEAQRINLYPSDVNELLKNSQVTSKSTESGINYNIDLTGVKTVDDLKLVLESSQSNPTLNGAPITISGDSTFITRLKDFLKDDEASAQLLEPIQRVKEVGSSTRDAISQIQLVTPKLEFSAGNSALITSGLTTGTLGYGGGGYKTITKSAEDDRDNFGTFTPIPSPPTPNTFTPPTIGLLSATGDVVKPMIDTTVAVPQTFISGIGSVTTLATGVGLVGATLMLSQFTDNSERNPPPSIGGGGGGGGFGGSKLGSAGVGWHNIIRNPVLGSGFEPDWKELKKHKRAKNNAPTSELEKVLGRRIDELTGKAKREKPSKVKGVSSKSSGRRPWNI